MYYRVDNPHGGDTYDKKIRIDFSANVNPYGTPQSVIRAAKDALLRTADYPDPYCRELVRAISRKQGVPEEMVYAGSGAAELIYAFAAGNRFGKAVVVSPTFVEYRTALRNAGTVCIPYLCRRENGFMPDEDLFAFLEKERPDTVFICNPNNPTGRSVSPDYLERLLDTAEKINACLFADECFYELSDTRVTLKDSLSKYGNLFILRAFTKCFALASLRIGYCMCSDPGILGKMSKVTPPWSVSGPAQKAAVAALDEEEYVLESVRKLRAERQYLAEGLSGAGIRVYPSCVNYLFIEGPPDLQERLRERGIEIRSCANYDGLGPGFFRVAVRTREDNEELIKAL